MFKTDFNLDEIKKQRGKKHEGFIELCSKVDGSKIRMPYIIICGEQDGPTFLVDCCIHGDEYEGAEGIIKATRSLSPKDIKGTLVTVPVVNLEAFADGQRVAKMDWTLQDMNRCFPGNPEGLITQRIAYFYTENFIKKADVELSFHGGGNFLYLEPLCAARPPRPELFEYNKSLAKAFGVQVIWIGLPSFAGTTLTATTEAGIPLLVAELGGQGVRHEHREELVDRCANGIKNVMKKMGMLDGEVKERDDYVEVKLKYVHTDEGGFHHMLKKPLEAFKKGDVVAEVTDLFGDKVGEVRAPMDGVLVGYWSYSTINPGNWSFLMGYTD